MLILTITALTSDNVAGVTCCFADVMQILSDVVCVSFNVCFDLDFCCWMLVLCAAIMSDLSIKSYWLHSCLCSTRCSRQKPGALVLLSRYQYRIADRTVYAIITMYRYYNNVLAFNVRSLTCLEIRVDFTCVWFDFCTIIIMTLLLLLL